MAHVTTKGHGDIPGLGCHLGPCPRAVQSWLHTYQLQHLGELSLSLALTAWESWPQGYESRGAGASPQLEH